MKEKLQKLIASNLDLERFTGIDISYWGISLRGDYSPELAKYLADLGVRLQYGYAGTLKGYYMDILIVLIK